MKNLYQIQKVKNINTEIIFPARMKFINDEEGSSIFLNSLSSIGSIGILEFLPNAGVRGNHYHKMKREIMYVIDGVMSLYLWLPHEPWVEEVTIERGDLVTVEPNLGHAYKAIERTFGLKLSTDPYNSSDTVPDCRIK